MFMNRYEWLMRDRSIKEEALVKLFGSTARARILVFLYGHEGQPFYQREIMYETGLSLQPTQRELGNLMALGIVEKQETQNRVYYELNFKSPFYGPLKEICGSVLDKG